MSKWDDLFEKPQPNPDTTHHLRVVPPPAGEATPYATAALRSEAELVAATPNGQRNDALNKAAFRMGRHVGAGSIDAETVRSTLAAAGRAAGLPQHEIDTVLRDRDNSGINQGANTPRHPAPLDLPDLPPVTVLDLDTDTENDFWQSRIELAHIHAFARARRVSPWATLAVALARAVTAVPPHVVLPPIVGGIASLNIFVGLVGRSGSGKGAAEAVAAEAIDVGHIETHKTGSGEGIAHGYMRREKGEVIQHTTAVLFSVPEIDTLSALGNRQGATLMPELRSAWSGERLGFGYADPTKRLPVPAHQYRLCLVAGIQPMRAQGLLDDADGGTPQRFLWMPATDPDAPDQAPACPPPLRWTAPDTSPGVKLRQPSGMIHIAVCDEARRTIDKASVARTRGETDALDGHALLCRLKSAAALAILDSRLEVTDEDWDLAGIIQAKSDATRTSIQQALASAAHERLHASATTEGRRQVIVGEVAEDAAIKRASRNILRRLTRAGDWVGAAEARRALASRDRGYYDTALERLVEAGVVESAEADASAHHGGRIRLVDKGTR